MAHNPGKTPARCLPGPLSPSQPSARARAETQRFSPSHLPNSSSFYPPAPCRGCRPYPRTRGHAGDGSSRLRPPGSTRIGLFPADKAWISGANVTRIPVLRGEGWMGCSGLGNAGPAAPGRKQSVAGENLGDTARRRGIKPQYIRFKNSMCLKQGEAVGRFCSRGEFYLLEGKCPEDGARRPRCTGINSLSGLDRPYNSQILPRKSSIN